MTTFTGLQRECLAAAESLFLCRWRREENILVKINPLPGDVQDSLQYVVYLLSVRINHKYLAIKSSLASPAHDSTDTQGQMGKTLWWGVHLCSEDLSRWLDVIRFAEVSITLHYWLAHGVGLANTSTATKSFSFLPLSIKASWFSPSVDLDRLSMMSCKKKVL